MIWKQSCRIIFDQDYRIYSNKRRIWVNKVMSPAVEYKELKKRYNTTLKQHGRG